MKKYNSILIADDNPDVLLALKLLFQDYFEHIVTSKTPQTIKSLVRETEFEVIVLDMNFVAGVNTGNEGLFWMEEIFKIDPEASIIFLTAYADIEKAVEAMRRGAFDYVEKPWDDEKLIASVIKAISYRKAKKEISKLRKNQEHLVGEIKRPTDLLKGRSQSMDTVYKAIEKVAATDANVLILGENGTGKEVVANEIHYQSGRSQELFVNVDMGALTESLFESEMFGHVKGAFTDAKANKTGRFELASGGTLFLDEIGNLPLNLQSKLLVAIQNREITPVGSTKKIKTDIRLISATNKGLDQLSSSAEFREDLLYRINTITIELPPLRERLEDIPIFADNFLQKYTNKYQKNNMGISKKALEKLKKHPWPGNIRELDHAIEKAVILSENDILQAEDFFIQQPQSIKNENLNLLENEKRMILAALKKHHGKYTQAAEELGITRRTLYNKIKQYGF